MSHYVALRNIFCQDIARIIYSYLVSAWGAEHRRKFSATSMQMIDATEQIRESLAKLDKVMSSPTYNYTFISAKFIHNTDHWTLNYAYDCNQTVLDYDFQTNETTPKRMIMFICGGNFQIIFKKM